MDEKKHTPKKASDYPEDIQRDFAEYLPQEEVRKNNEFGGMAMGINFVVCVFLGMFVGYMLDKFLQTAPIFMLIFLCLGFGAGIRSIVKFNDRDE